MRKCECDEVITLLNDYAIEETEEGSKVVELKGDVLRIEVEFGNHYVYQTIEGLKYDFCPGCGGKIKG